MRTTAYALVAAAMIIAGVTVPATAGIAVYDKDGKKIEVGGRIQLQYRNADASGGGDFDEIFFRRLRPYIQGTVTEDWMGKIQFDFGKAEDSNEVALKDAYMQYLGWENHKITIGNSKTPFSREFLASSKRQQLVERSFTGDHNFGSPDRQLGIRLDGSALDKKITYAASLGTEEHDPAINRMDFDSPANAAADWNEGVVVAARLDYHPLGYMKFDQADFRSDEWKINFSVAAFNWSNDDDNNTYTDSGTGMVNATGLADGKVDLDSAEGLELSAGVRGMGFSADIEFQKISGDTVDPTFTGGLYANGKTDLDIIAVEAGYMVASNVEVVAGWDTFDADNFTASTDRTSLGLNWYWNKHKAKLQLTYRTWDSVTGVPGSDLDEVIAQAQFVF
ncbi:MAG: OprO/OprP family phosphate-selective porin [Acidobacteriota bacterium]|nr:OprO/OprP family phosphate-selective porin [Acidobacteriota bacterium]MDH3784293.1 OprO/OprP family phosphate-selective porin [Acidobacteriota bacterium]